MSLHSNKVDVITGISSMAVRNLLTELVDAYEHESQQRVAIVSVGGVEAARRVSEGEPFDFVVLAADMIGQLAARGRVDPVSRTDLARSGIAIGVAAGAPRPQAGCEAEIRETILRARGIGYSTGPSGSHLAHLLDLWGIAAEVAPRLVQAPPGVPVGTLIARGDVELGFQQLSELLHLPGIDVVAMLPPEIQLVTTFSAARCTASDHEVPTRRLFTFLASPETEAAKRRHGMEPA